MRFLKIFMGAGLIFFLFLGCAVKEPKSTKSVQLTVDNYQEQIKNGKVMVFFYLPNDINSIDMFASLKEVDFKKEGITLYPVDINKEMKLYRYHKLEYVPTIFYLKDSKMIKQDIGAKTPQQLKQIITDVYKGL